MFEAQNENKNFANDYFEILPNEMLVKILHNNLTAKEAAKTASVSNLFRFFAETHPQYQQELEKRPHVKVNILYGQALKDEIKALSLVQDESLFALLTKSQKQQLTIVHSSVSSYLSKVAAQQEQEARNSDTSRVLNHCSRYNLTW